MAKWIGFVGTYTKGESEGIYSFILDTDAKKITEVKVAAQTDNPTYLSISKNNQYLYAVAKNGNDGGVTAFSIGNDRTLQRINEQTSFGAPPCHVSVDRENRNVLSANYHKGTIEAHAVDPESGALQPDPTTVDHNEFRAFQPNQATVDHNEFGTLPQIPATVNHNEFGTFQPNQATVDHSEFGTLPQIPATVELKETGADEPLKLVKAHAHYAGFTPDEKYIVAIDLGIDQVMTYKLSNAQQQLIFVTALQLPLGSGPRHLVFHPNGTIAYLMTEFSSEVIVLTYDQDTGHFSVIQTISTLPEDFTGNNQGSAIHISSDGRFVYAANRGHNSIAIFTVNPQTFELEVVEHTKTLGNWPRDFALDPSEEFIVASNQESGNLVLFARNQETGRLTALQTDVFIPDPVCVKFLKA